MDLVKHELLWVRLDDFTCTDRRLDGRKKTEVTLTLLEQKLGAELDLEPRFL